MTRSPAHHDEPPVTAFPVPAGTPLIILVGGTFDPPHRAHIDLPVRARSVLEQRAGCPDQAWLVYIAAARSPHKSTGPIASDVQRIDMLRLALARVPRAAVWTDEIDRAAHAPQSPSYTVDTVARARRALDARSDHAAVIRLLIGADQALAFHRWHQPGRVRELAAPAVMLRPPLADAAIFIDALRAGGAWSEAELSRWRECLLEIGVVDAAATSVRAMLAAGADNAALQGLLDPGVLAYIRTSNLYSPPHSPMPPHVPSNK